MNLKIIKKIIKKLSKYMFYEALQGLMLIAYMLNFLMFMFTESNILLVVGAITFVVTIFCFVKKVEYSIKIFRSKTEE